MAHTPQTGDPASAVLASRMRSLVTGLEGVREQVRAVIQLGTAVGGDPTVMEPQLTVVLMSLDALSKAGRAGLPPSES